MADGFGLDKKARLEAQAAEKALAEKPEPLNPPWPYVAEPFDPAFFGVGAALEVVE